MQTINSSYEANKWIKVEIQTSGVWQELSDKFCQLKSLFLAYFRDNYNRFWVFAWGHLFVNRKVWKHEIQILVSLHSLWRTNFELFCKLLIWYLFQLRKKLCSLSIRLSNITNVCFPITPWKKEIRWGYQHWINVSNMPANLPGYHQFDWQE